MGDAVINQTTSSGLVKFIAANNQGFLLSPEVYEVLNKLLKSDEDNASGDIQLLCKMFSGEQASYRYSTETTRTIKPSTPFCILGSTQLSNAAKLIARMDFGHGLIDRILLSAPMALRPTLRQMEAAKDLLKDKVVSDFVDAFQNILQMNDEVVFTFDAPAKQLLRQTIDDFVQEVNDAILQGSIPPKSKTPELVPRLATALHVLNHVLKEILNGLTPSDPPTIINLETLACAISLANYLESQKLIMCEVRIKLSCMFKMCNPLYSHFCN